MQQWLVHQAGLCGVCLSGSRALFSPHGCVKFRAVKSIICLGDRGRCMIVGGHILPGWYSSIPLCLHPTLSPIQQVPSRQPLILLAELIGSDAMPSAARRRRIIPGLSYCHHSIRMVHWGLPLASVAAIEPHSHCYVLACVGHSSCLQALLNLFVFILHSPIRQWCVCLGHAVLCPLAVVWSAQQLKLGGPEWISRVTLLVFFQLLT